MRRSGIEVDMDILSTIASGTKKPTHIMYQSNLSWAPLRTRLTRLVERGLVTIEDITGKGDKRLKVNYFLTRKGRDVLAQYSALSTMIGTG